MLPSYGSSIYTPISEANKQHVVMKDKKKELYHQKLSKCKDVEIEIKKMWDLKTITVPVMLGDFKKRDKLKP